MMAVELESPSGEELQLSSNKKATLKFPIPDGQDVSQYNSIPTWHLDENTGIWIEEGEAIIEADFLVAEVSHFSFWNCDIPFPFVNITGSLVSEEGLPLPYQTVVIKDNDNNISQSGFTNESGIFSGKVPADVDLTMFHFDCDENQFITEIGILTEDTDLGEISVTGKSSTLLLAELVDCKMQAITNGYVKITSPSETKICLLYTSPSPRDATLSRMPSSA